MIVDAPGVPHPLRLRNNTSDEPCYRQAFGGQYDPLLDLTLGLVLDLGAYIGLSTVWMLSRWPECRVIAVEPDRENFALLKENTAPYGDRVRLVYGGAWSHLTALRPVEETLGLGQEWGRRMEECPRGGVSTCPGYPVANLIGDEQVGLLKCDIEGAEVQVFADAPWLAQVGAIAIELHDRYAPDASAVFARAIDGQYAVTQSGELTICRR